MGLNADEVWLNWAVFLFHAFISCFPSPPILLYFTSYSWHFNRSHTNSMGHQIHLSNWKQWGFISPSRFWTSSWLPVAAVAAAVPGRGAGRSSHPSSRWKAPSRRPAVVRPAPSRRAGTLRPKTAATWRLPLSSHSGQRQQRLPPSSTEDTHTQRFRLKPWENK